MDSYVELDGWNLNIRFSSAHLIPGDEKCGRLHGHTYAIHAKVYGKQDAKGFILDFSLLKATLKQIAESLDHTVLIAEQNRSVTLDENEVRLSVEGRSYVFPREDCTVLPLANITAENLAAYVLSQIVQTMDLPKNVTRIEVTIDEGLGQGATVEKCIR